MIDPLTAFSTAASALQFAEVAVKLIRKSIEYSAGGGSVEHQALQNLIQQLTISNAHLQTSLDRSRHNSKSHGPARALYLANEECLTISKEVYRLLDGLKLNRSCTIWRSVKLALKTLTTKEKFQTLLQRLEHARANLTLSLMVYLQDRSASDREAHEAGHKNLCQQIRAVTAETSGLASNIADLASKFDNVHIHEPALMYQWEQAVRRDSLRLQPVSQKILNLVTQLDSEFTNLREEVHKLLPTMSTEVLARRKILESLFFSKMHSRRHRVVRAHGSTYQWLFKHKEDRSLVWHDFVSWLCHDDKHSVYWISGKPGCGKTTLMRELDDHILRESRVGSTRVVLPQQESDEWLKIRREGEKDASLYEASVRVHTQPAYLVTDPSLTHSVHEQSVLQNELTAWIGQSNLLTASRYFWYAGITDERSILGLLRGLAHQLLSQRPDLIDKVVPSEMWYSACCQDNIAIHWEETDLIATLQKFGLYTQHNDKIFLIIDGLDECHGTDGQQERLLDLIKDLTRMKHIKACVASRPWNAFRDAFRDCPQLRLEDLTRDDIERYVVDTFSEDYYFQQPRRADASLLSVVSRIITDRARGVFLWVRLVIRDLLRFLRDGGRPSDLLRELERVPPDLNQYFERMIGEIEEPYRKDAAMILLTALRNMDFQRDDGNAYSGPDFLLIHLDYLSEDEKIEIADEGNIDSAFDSSKSDLLERLERRLASRCMGLLEIDASPPTSTDEHISDGYGEHTRAVGSASYFRNNPIGGRAIEPGMWVPQNVRIEFLHRTVRDFLTLEFSQQRLRDFAGPSFDSHWFRCNMLVLDAASFRKISRQSSWIHATVGFFRQILHRPCTEDVYKLYEKMVEVMDKGLLQNGAGCAYREPANTYRALAEAIIDWSDHKSSALSLAIQLGWNSYVMSRLSKELVHSKEGRPLLDYALRPCYDQSQKADPEIIRAILRVGAQPDSSALASSRVPTWVYYFQSLQYQDLSDSTSDQDVIQALLQSGIDRRVSESDVKSVHRELCRRPFLDERKLCHGISMLRAEGRDLMRLAEKTVSHRLQHTVLSNQPSERRDKQYTALDVLRSLTILIGRMNGRALFTEEDIKGFECSSLKQIPGPVSDERFHNEGAEDKRKRQRAMSQDQHDHPAKQLKYNHGTDILVGHGS